MVYDGNRFRHFNLLTCVLNARQMQQFFEQLLLCSWRAREKLRVWRL